MFFSQFKFNEIVCRTSVPARVRGLVGEFPYVMMSS